MFQDYRSEERLSGACMVLAGLLALSGLWLVSDAGGRGVCWLSGLVLIGLGVVTYLEGERA